MSSSNSRSAIIGGGLAGTLTLIHLLKKQAPQIIYIFEKQNELGLGRAYSTKESHHLLNVIASKMSLFVDEPNDLIDWLNNNSYKNCENEFIPRKLYGNYIRQRLKAALDNNKIHHVHHIKSHVKEIKITNDEFGISDGDNNLFSVQKIILATGNETPQYPSIFKDVINSARLISDPWVFDFDKIPTDARILILGTGLTMVDQYLTLSNKVTRPIVALSRRGLLPQVHNLKKTNFIATEELLKPASLMSLTKQFRTQIFSDPDEWQTRMDSLRPHHQTWWIGLTPKEKQRFQRHIAPYWNIYRHRLAPSINNRLQEALKTGQLKVISARIKNVHFDNEFKIEIQNRKSNSTKPLEFDYIINCTGHEGGPQGQPLYQCLVKNQLVSFDTMGFLKTDNFGKCLNQNNEPVKGIWATGPLLKGVLGEVTAVPEIRKQVKTLAQLL